MKAKTLKAAVFYILYLKLCSKCSDCRYWSDMMIWYAVAILELKKWGGHCGAKEKVGGANKVIYWICIGPMSTKWTWTVN